LTDKALRDENARAHEALRISEIRNRDLVENAVYGIFRVSADGSFLYANPALLRIVGCPDADDLKTLNLATDVFRFPEQYAQLMAASREQGQLHGAEAEWRRRDGGIIAVRLHLRWLSSTDHPDALEVIAEDVTEVRAMERRLRHSQKFEAIGQLAGGIAHDFNNAIGAILGWAELGFDQNRSTPQVAERFSRIREQAERAAALTRELLAFSRRQVLQPRAVDLNNVTSGLVSFLDKIIGKQVELKLQQAPLDSVKADPAQIEQVLMNLCLNARDAMPEGGRLVIETEMVELDETYCRFYPQVAPGRYAVISVCDTGTGMDVETRERIFEPFFTTKERGKATGMGLACTASRRTAACFAYIYGRRMERRRTEPPRRRLRRVRRKCTAPKPFFLPTTMNPSARCPGRRWSAWVTGCFLLVTARKRCGFANTKSPRWRSSM
jgi:two-component system cell cycle sensor histidine kinase/response regulator CckA